MKRQVPEPLNKIHSSNENNRIIYTLLKQQKMNQISLNINGTDYEMLHIATEVYSNTPILSFGGNEYIGKAIMKVSTEKDILIEFEEEMHKPKNKFPYLLLALNLIFIAALYYEWDYIFESTKYYLLFLIGFNIANMLNKF